MQALAIDLRLLPEAGGPGLRLLPGRALMARVMAADGSGRGLLNIAGAVIEAELPKHVRAGEQLRLIVRALDEHRVTLALPTGEERNPVAPPPSPPAAVPLPGGGTLRVMPDEEHDGGSGGGRDPATSALALRYDAPALGALDLRFELDAGSLRVTIAAAPGPGFELAGREAEELRAALAALGERAVSVTVRPRREPLDLYA